MGLITYLVIKFIAVAHENEWVYLTTGWGAWWLLEIFLGVLVPLFLFAYGIHNKQVGLVRVAAFFTVAGIVLNRLNTALITFNWKLYQEVPHVFEVIISITIFAIYIATYRFILNRLPILYAWKAQPVEVTVTETVDEKTPIEADQELVGA